MDTSGITEFHSRGGGGDVVIQERLWGHLSLWFRLITHV